jgi:hypothetical protein
VFPYLVFRIGSRNGANTIASTTFDAGCSVDNILAIALSYSSNRAFTFACAAADALIVNYI